MRARGGARPCGSSPLARGLLDDVVAGDRERGIIPARAGFTDRAPYGVPGRADHPRSRGVYSYTPSISIDWGGSSPLARGLRRHHLHHGRPRRIIPARAGFTRRRPPSRRPRSDHPRSRGVYRATSTATNQRPGSSPLARGLLSGPAPAAWVRGIIPARAGFTRRDQARDGRLGDHPRSRGVYAGWARTRPMVPRIIPARAGFTRPDPHRPSGPGDHPRSRGVYSPSIGVTRTISGSSPLARGLPPPTEETTKAPGIIPARAGFTLPYR